MSYFDDNEDSVTTLDFDSEEFIETMQAEYRQACKELYEMQGEVEAI